MCPAILFVTAPSIRNRRPLTHLAIPMLSSVPMFSSVQLAVRTGLMPLGLLLGALLSSAPEAFAQGRLDAQYEASLVSIRRS